MSLTQPTVEAVRLVITTAMNDTAVAAFIEDATLLAEGCAGIASLTPTRQAAIVKWLTAHLIATHSGGGGQLTQKSLGDASESYAAGAAGVNLNATRYGQQAVSLDTTGCLANLGKAPAFCELC